MNKIKISKKVLKDIRTTTIILDIFAIILLITQIIIKDVSYVAHILLILLNIFIFLLKPNDEEPNS